MHAGFEPLDSMTERQLTHVQTERQLTHVQASRGPSGVQLLGNDETAQQTQVHSPIPARYPAGIAAPEQVSDSLRRELPEG